VVCVVLLGRSINFLAMGLACISDVLLWFMSCLLMAMLVCQLLCAEIDTRIPFIGRNITGPEALASLSSGDVD
jgi:hypothetical protein